LPHRLPHRTDIDFRQSQSTLTVRAGAAAPRGILTAGSQTRVGCRSQSFESNRLEMVGQNSVSWNRIAVWLGHLNLIRAAASPRPCVSRSSDIRVKHPKSDATALRTPGDGRQFPRRTNARIPVKHTGHVVRPVRGSAR
jgi:hypothetical protein